MKTILSLITGSGSTMLSLLWETLFAILGRVAWKVVIERLLTRLINGALDWVAGLSSNTVTKKTVADIKEHLNENGLKKAK